jgi:hypothetical protein
MHHQIKIAHRRKRDLGIGNRFRQVAAQTQQRFGFAVAHRLYCFNGAMTMLLRRAETKHLLQTIKQRLRRDLCDAHRAIALHIGVTA